VSASDTYSSCTHRVLDLCRGPASLQPMSVAHVHALQDQLCEVETYKTGDIWLGSVASQHIPEGQAVMQEAFERVHQMLRQEVLSIFCVEAEAPKPNARATEERMTTAERMIVLGPNHSPVSEALLPTFCALSDLHRLLLAYLPKKGALDAESLAHFYWLQYQLNHLEVTLKHDGVWLGSLVGGVIPIGQAMLQEKLESCHRVAHQINIDRETHERHEVGEHKSYDSWKEMRRETEAQSRCTQDLVTPVAPFLTA
jgi:hypothetical protein